MYQKILVPVDGSEASNSGLLEAIKLAKSQNATLRLLNVVDEHVLDPEFCLGTYPGNVAEAFREAGKKVLHEAGVLARRLGVAPESISVESLGGKAAPVIVDQAKSWAADLIVMGTHGRRGLKRLAMGSDAEDVVRGTRIPVLLIHDSSDATPESQKEEPAAA